MKANLRKASLALLIACAATANCAQFGGLGALGTAACPELGGNADALHAQISANAQANVKVRAFVQAAKDLVAVSAQIEAEAADACRRMGTDLGMSPAELAPRQGHGGQAQGACEALAARIDSILRQGFSVRASVTPPRCEASAQATAACEGSCSVELSPGEIVARCDPGRLSGTCQGRCSGQCDGRCSGQCQGTCTARDAAGNCSGACQGQCQGSCDATCHARCEGTWLAPRCEGSVRPPSADAECGASCRAHANVHASCTPAVVQVQSSANAEMAMRLLATLRANLPELLHAQLALGKRLAGDAQTVAEVGAALPRIVGDAGVHALSCIAAGADATASASIRIRVSVQASASVTGKVGAGG
jgi:hypothetical protein